MLTFAPPCEEVGHQIACVETFAGDEASSESESYGGVIGAFARARVKGAAGHLDVVGEGITGENSGLMPRVSPTARPRRRP